ncbi:MAG: chitobiase/beta-hexosaminidase C-terminal domain-containing protein [Chitinophagales bacterium]|nr:chitobiase/beta-hexosaminidase C-terminal domain-containing protein [Chitinophagales bacterium]
MINVTITESSEQISSGIPKFVELSTDIISNIYYTLDGTDPTYMSMIYIDKIRMPASSPTITLKVFASNGLDSSNIVEKKYFPISADNVKYPYSLTDSEPNKNTNTILYPFGTNSNNPKAIYSNPSNSDRNISSLGSDGYSNGFDGSGNPGNYTDKPFTTENYQIQYSTANAIGETGKGIGNLPAEVLVQLKTQPPEESEAGDKLFDPRAMVVYVDTRNQDDDDDPYITSQYLNLEPPEVGDGAKLYAVGINSPNASATWIRSHHNKREGTLTNYYFDTKSNRWLIIKSQYNPKQTFDNISGYVLGHGAGAKYVYSWYPWMRRVIG